MLSHARNVLARILCSISTGITCSLVRSTLGPSPAMITSWMCQRNWLATAVCECGSTGRSPLLQLTTTNKVMYRSGGLAFQDVMNYAMCLSSVIASAAARSMVSMVSCNSVTNLTLRLAAKSEDTDVITLSRTSLSHLRSYLSLARFTPNFYVSCEWWLTCRRLSISSCWGRRWYLEWAFYLPIDLITLVQSSGRAATSG